MNIDQLEESPFVPLIGNQPLDVEKIRADLGLKISLVRVFQFPTLSSLAAAIAGSETDPDHTAVPPEQNRGQLRREMMQRRREGRGSRSPR